MDVLACCVVLAVVLVPANDKSFAWFFRGPFRTSFCQALGLFSHQAVTHSPRMLYRDIVSRLALEMTPYFNLLLNSYLPQYGSCALSWNPPKVQTEPLIMI